MGCLRGEKTSRDTGFKLGRRWLACWAELSTLLGVLRCRSSNCLSNPPIPSFSKEKSLVLNKLLFTVVCFWLPILIPLPCGASNTNFVSGVIDPRIDVTPKAAPSTSMLLTVTR